MKQRVACYVQDTGSTTKGFVDMVGYHWHSLALLLCLTVVVNSEMEPVNSEFSRRMAMKRHVRDQLSNRTQSFTQRFTPGFLFTNNNLPSLTHKITEESKVKVMNAKVHYITFADGCCKRGATQACQKALEVGVDVCYIFALDDIDKNFMQKNKEVMKLKRGAGYWTWKPYIVYQTLSVVNEGDYVVYQDAGAHLTAPVHLILAFMEVRDKRRRREHSGVLAFKMDWLHSHWCKRDAFIGQGCDTPQCHDTGQIDGSFHVWRKGIHALNVSSMWLNEIQDIQLVSDSPNIFGLPNLPGFQEHRHDQAILTNIFTREHWNSDTEHHGLLSFRNHHRNRN